MFEYAEIFERKIVEYEIIFGDLYTLDALVSEKIKLGFEPFGAPCFAIGPHNDVWQSRPAGMQAMVRYKDD